MTPEELKERTKSFGLQVIRMVRTLPRTREADVLGRQLLRSATAVGANYRAACRARSRSEFVSKISVVEEEADEAAYWLEMFEKTGVGNNGDVARLLREARELTAIFTASGRTAKRNPLGLGPRANSKSTIRNSK